MSVQLRLPPLVAGDHEWRVSKHDPEILERRAVGAEVPNGTGELTRAGANDLYIWATVRFQEPSTTLIALREKLREVLILLRSQHPEIGCTYRWDGDNIPFIQYRSLKDLHEAASWADNILHVRIGTENGLHIRDQIQAEKQGNETPRPLDIYLVASNSDIDTTLGNTKVELVFRTNHLSSDGISIRLVVGDILRTLGSSTLIDDIRNISWGDEHKNLSPPLLSILGDNQATSGQEFESSSASYMESVRRIMSTWKLKPKTGRASPRTIFHTFSLEESDRMIGAVKTRIGRTFSITHLGHAAVLLAFLKHNPPAEDVPNDQCCVVRSPMNARRFLQEQYAKEGKAYYPICLAMSPIVYDDIKSYNVLNATQDQIIEKLVKACKVTKETYDKWLTLPSLVPLSVSFFHLAASLMISNATPPPTSPFLVSDGINEKYIPQEVKSGDKEVFTVQDIRFFTNMYLNLLVFRLESWRGRLTLSLNYNDGNYTEVETAKFLQDVVNFMLAVCQ